MSTTTVSGVAIGWLVGAVVLVFDVDELDTGTDVVEGEEFEGGADEPDDGGVLGGSGELGAACTVIVPDPLMQLGEFGQVP